MLITETIRLLTMRIALLAEMLSNQEYACIRNHGIADYTSDLQHGLKHLIAHL